MESATLGDVTDRATILIVDDDPDMRDLVKAAIELDGRHRVVAEAVDGPDALAKYEELDAPPIPDVVILDNRMPDMTGLEVAERILTKVPSQQIVLFTAFDDAATLQRAAELGVSQVVSKSNFAQLPEIVRSLL